MVIEQQVDGEIDAQVGRGVWQGGAGALWSVGGGVTPLVYVIMLAIVREADLFQNGRIFGKVPKGGVGSFNPKNFVADFCHYRRYFGHEFRKNLDFLKMCVCDYECSNQSELYYSPKVGVN